MPPRRPAPNLPGFTLVEWLGGGGFADVFRYHDHSLDREVAIKVLHRGGTDKARQAFRNEASLMARLSSHPNIVSVFQVGVADDGRPFLVMEMCAPQHLGDAIARRPYGPAKAMELGIQIAGAVETAHRLGVLHRDIKPSNIMFTAFARPALTDFGISVSLGGDTSMQMAMSHLWASPEQFGSSPGRVGPWSDVYSLAATVWALLIGHSPMFIPGDSNDRLSLEARIRTMPTPRTMRADVPEELERVLAVGMAKDPRERFQSAIEFARALQSIQGLINQPVTSIDVFTEPGQVLDDESELLDEGTRISGFQLIDPDRPDSTSHATGPTSGTTAPDQSGFSTGGHGAYTVPGPVLQHGRGVAAAFMLGAVGVQVGTRFLVADECTVSEEYKERVLKAGDISTMVTGRSGGHPVRCLKTPFTRRFAKAESAGASQDELNAMGAGSLRKAAREGDYENGSFMCGQIAGLVKRRQSAAEIVDDLVGGAEKVLKGATTWVR